MSKHYIIGVFGDEEPLLEAVKEVRASGTRIHEVYTPFPVHGLDELLGYKRSRSQKLPFCLDAWVLPWRLPCKPGCWASIGP